jgi:hypothetical protein
MAAVAGYIQNVYCRSDATSVVSGDKVSSVTECSIEEPTDMAEWNQLGAAYKQRVATVKDVTGSVSFKYDFSNAPQALLRATGTTVYVTVEYDNAQSAGSKGKRYVFLVTGVSPKVSGDGVVEFTVSLVGNGTAPTAI